jgi:YggT family protein
LSIICLISYAVAFYELILFVRIILSWTTMFWSPPTSLTPVIRVVYDLTEPVMGFFRRFIPPVGGFDFSPIIIFVILEIVRSRLAC